MPKHLLSLFVIILLFNACSTNAIFPTDTKVYDSPTNYAYSYEEFYFASSQDALLRGWWFRSKGTSKGMVVVANGMIYNMSSRFKEWTWLLDEGYDLFIFDYRGYGESMGAADILGFVDDVASAVAFAHALNEDLPMVAVGQSMGGSFVIDAVAKNRYPYVRLLVIDSTMTSFGAAAEEIMEQHILLWPWSWLPGTMTPAGVDSIDFVDKTDTPTLFLVGLKDEVIQPKHSADLFVKAQEPKAIWIVEEAKHVQCIDDGRVKKDLAYTFEEAVKGSLSLGSDVRYYDKNSTYESEREELR